MQNRFIQVLFLAQIPILLLPIYSRANCPIEEINDLKKRAARGLPKELLFRYEYGIKLLDLANQCFLKKPYSIESPNQEHFFRKNSLLTVMINCFSDGWEESTRDTLHFLNDEFNSSRFKWTTTEIIRFKTLLSQFINSTREILNYWHTVRLSEVYAHPNELALRAALLKAQVAQTPEEAFGIIETFLQVYPQECRLLETGVHLAVKFGYDSSRYLREIVALDIHQVPDYYKEFVKYYQNQVYSTETPYLLNFKLPPAAHALPREEAGIQSLIFSHPTESQVTESTDARAQFQNNSIEKISAQPLNSLDDSVSASEEVKLLTPLSQSQLSQNSESPNQAIIRKENQTPEFKKDQPNHSAHPKQEEKKEDALATPSVKPPLKERVQSTSKKKSEWKVAPGRSNRGNAYSSSRSFASQPNPSGHREEKKQPPQVIACLPVIESPPLKIASRVSRTPEISQEVETLPPPALPAEKKTVEPLKAKEIIRRLKHDPSLELIRLANLLLQTLNERKRNSDPSLKPQDLMDRHLLMATISSVPSFISNISEKEQIKLLKQTLLGAFEADDLSNFTEYLSSLIILKSSDSTYLFEEHIKQLEKLTSKKEGQKDPIYIELSKIAQVFMEQELYPQSMVLHEMSQRILEEGSENWKENEAKIEMTSRILLYATKENSLKIQEALKWVAEIHSSFSKGSTPSKSKLNSLIERTAPLFQFGMKQKGLLSSIFTSTVSSLLAFKNPNAPSRKIAEDYYELLIDDYESNSHVILSKVPVSM